MPPRIPGAGMRKRARRSPVRLVFLARTSRSRVAGASTSSPVRNMLHENCDFTPRFAHLLLACLIAGCAADDSPSSGSDGDGTVQTFSANGGQQASGGTGAVGTSPSGGSSGTSGTVSGATNPTPAGSDATN